MKTILILLASLMCVLAAPRRPLRTYDQRQEGSLNVHGRLDNFVFVLGIPAELNFREFGRPIAADRSESEGPSIARVALPEESDDRREDPVSSIPEADKSSVKIVAIVEEDRPLETAVSASSSSGSDSNLQEDKKTKEVKDKAAKSEEVHTKSARSLKNRSSETSSVSKLPPRDSGSAPLENKITDIAEKNPGNDVGSVETESKLIGDGIENCGPGRFRNRAGICQFREDV